MAILSMWKYDLASEIGKFLLDFVYLFINIHLCVHACIYMHTHI